MLIVGFFASLLTQCGDMIKEAQELNVLGKTAQQIDLQFGIPRYRNSIMVSKNSSLHEYQSSLYYLLTPQQSDSITVVEWMYETPKETLVIWFTNRNDTLRVVDALEWPSDIQF